MNRKISVNLALAIAIIAMTVTFSVTMILSQNLFENTVASVRDKEAEYKKLAELDKTVRADAYFNIDDTTLYDMLGVGYMAGISDANARYYTAKQYVEYLNEEAGRSIGIGVDFVKESGSYPRVIRTYNASPADDLGIANGYTLRQIDGVDLKSLTTSQINVLLRGTEGTTISLVYADIAGTESAATDVQRRQYETISVETQQNENEVVGYIKIITFNSQTAGELQRAIDVMKSSAQGLQGIVIDVRNNTGGNVRYALDALDTLCPAGPMGYQEFKDGSTELLGVSNDANQIDVPVVVLVNSGTAAGAELFAAGIREFGIGQVVGTTTQGKGTVQCTPVRLTDGSAVSYTVGLLLTSQGEGFDGQGIVPDVEVLMRAEEERSFYDLTPDTDSQILRAKEVLLSIINRTSGTDSSSSSTSQSSSVSSQEATSEEVTGDEATNEEIASEETTSDSVA